MTSRLSDAEVLYRTIGWPIGSGTYTPPPERVEGMTRYAFKSRVGLLFMEECERKGVEIGPDASILLESLRTRREATSEVIETLAEVLNPRFARQWVVFKSIKPFPATPNDTDWFPLDPRQHAEMVEVLLSSGKFDLLETAPRQTTLIEVGGRGTTDTTKKGGVYYIDCYVIPSTDYFVYLDTTRLDGLLVETQLGGQSIQMLRPEMELAALMFHAVFPERSLTPENYYLTKSYLERIRHESSMDAFAAIVRRQRYRTAATVNLLFTQAIDQQIFGIQDPDLDDLIAAIRPQGVSLSKFDPLGSYPFNVPNALYWRSFAERSMDRTSARSLGVQAVHMLNPVFLVDVLRVLWRRSVRGGVYEQN